MDSNTPLANVNEIISGFNNAHHVIVEYAGHENILSNPKAQKLFIDYFSGKGPSFNKIIFDKPIFEPIP